MDKSYKEFWLAWDKKAKKIKYEVFEEKDYGRFSDKYNALALVIETRALDVLKSKHWDQVLELERQIRVLESKIKELESEQG